MSRVFGWLLVFGLVLASSAWAGAKAEVPHASFDFGHVSQNKTLTHTFWIKSVGDDTLRITGVWPGCGCTQVPLLDSAAAPGDSLPISIIFFTGRYTGLVKKDPSVMTNCDPSKIEFKLSLMAHADKEVSNGPLRVQPDLVDVSQFGEKTRRQAKFLIENLTDQDLFLAVVDSSMKSFEFKLPEKVLAGETVEGRIRVNEDKIEKDFDESLTFRVTNLDNAVYTVPIQRMFRPKS